MAAWTDTFNTIGSRILGFDYITCASRDFTSTLENTRQQLSERLYGLSANSVAVL